MGNLTVQHITPTQQGSSITWMVYQTCFALFSVQVNNLSSQTSAHLV